MMATNIRAELAAALVVIGPGKSVLKVTAVTRLAWHGFVYARLKIGRSALQSVLLWSSLPSWRAVHRLMGWNV